jgi:hypothetical protein
MNDRTPRSRRSSWLSLVALTYTLGLLSSITTGVFVGPERAAELPTGAMIIGFLTFWVLRTQSIELRYFITLLLCTFLPPMLGFFTYAVVVSHF